MEVEDTTIETKVLKFSDSIPFKSSNSYRLEIETPPKIELLKMLQSNEVFQSNNIIFSSGVLAGIPHSIKIEIKTQTFKPEKRELYICVFIKVNTNPTERAIVYGMKGTCGAYVEDGSFKALSEFKFVSIASSNDDLEMVDYLRYEPSWDTNWKWPDLTTTVTVIFHVGKINYSMIVNNNSKVPIKPISLNAEPFFMSEFCSDVKLKVGNSIFPAHKLVLSARSEYFQLMFSTEMRESIEGVIEITDVNENLVREMLLFLYTNQLENLEKHAKDVFVLADKYAIPELSAYCENYLLSTLCVENAAELFDLSQSVGLTGKLFQASKEIIFKNKEKFSPSLETFRDFFARYPELIFELLKL